MYNPIRSVTPCDSFGKNTGAAVTNIPCPYHNGGYPWNKDDISDEDAGRVESYRMVKKRKGRVVKINLVWKTLTLAEASIVLKAFAPEYVNVEFLDAEEGAWITRTFYTGGMKASLYNSKKGIWDSVSFNIIQSIPDEEV